MSARVAIAQFEGSSTLRAPPLAAGLLAATLSKAPDLAAIVPELHHRRRPPDAAAAALTDTAVLGVSLYTWNERYTLEVVRRVKAVSPDTLIVAGGPSVPRRDADVAAWLDAHPALDTLVHGEGERVFADIVRAHLSGRPVAGLPGTSTRTPAGLVRTARGPRLAGDDFLTIGSPYLDGTFDRLLADPGAPHVDAVVLETNRGCPFSCTFCDWGQAIESRVNELPLERVLAEVRWAAERAIPYVYFVDANFGIRKRDVDIVRAIGEIAAATGYPRYVYFHLTKNATDKNLATAEALLAAGIGTQVSLSMQDFDAAVLAAVRRDNIHPERALELRARCHALGLPTTNELMLGLPAQSAESFRRSLVQALTPFPDDSFFLYPTRVLVNAELADPAERARHGLVTRVVPSLPRDAHEPVHVVEYEELIVGSHAMSVDAWRDAFAFGHLFAALVNQRLLATTLRLLGFALDVDLVVALDALLAAPSARLQAVRGAVLRHADAILAGEGVALAAPGYGPTRREATETACAAALDDWAAFSTEIADVLTRLVPEQARALVRDAIAWDSLQIPARVDASRPASPATTSTFAYDWPRWRAADHHRPARAHLVVRRDLPAWSGADPGPWLDTFIALGWSKSPRVTLTEIDRTYVEEARRA